MYLPSVSTELRILRRAQLKRTNYLETQFCDVVCKQHSLSTETVLFGLGPILDYYWSKLAQTSSMVRTPHENVSGENFILNLPFFVHIESLFVHIHSRVFIQISNCDIFLCTLTCRQPCKQLLTSHIKSDGAEYLQQTIAITQSDWCSQLCQ